ncbi:MAG: hypothetical protein AB7V62_07305 [Thermoleophilia bacterium]
MLDETVDPVELVGERPPVPIPVDGWGAIPDQYGRNAFEEDEEA